MRKIFLNVVVLFAHLGAMNDQSSLIDTAGCQDVRKIDTAFFHDSETKRYVQSIKAEMSNDAVVYAWRVLQDAHYVTVVDPSGRTLCNKKDERGVIYDSLNKHSGNNHDVADAIARAALSEPFLKPPPIVDYREPDRGTILGIKECFAHVRSLIPAQSHRPGLD